MRTPEEIAEATITSEYGTGTCWAEENEFGESGFTRAQAETDIGQADIARLIATAIKADREERLEGFDNALPKEIHDCLHDRESEEASAAAAWVKDNENDQVWDLYLGPLLDQIEREQG